MARAELGTLPGLVSLLLVLTATSQAQVDNRRTSSRWLYFASSQSTKTSSADCNMPLPDVHCVVCGGPFDNPHEELMEGRYPDAGLVDHITNEELEVPKTCGPRTEAVC